MKNVLIVEDHPFLSDAARLMIASLDAEITTVVSANAGDALKQIDDSGVVWDRIFLDLEVPGAMGLSLAREIEKRGLAERCCVVTGHNKPEYIAATKRWKFLGYIDKSLKSETFKDAWLNALRGVPCFPVSGAGCSDQPMRLPRRQIQILELIRDGRSSREIGSHLHLAEGTINNHVNAIFHSLRASNRAQAVTKAIEFGLVGSHATVGGAV